MRNSIRNILPKVILLFLIFLQLQKCPFKILVSAATIPADNDSEQPSPSLPVQLSSQFQRNIFKLKFSPVFNILSDSSNERRYRYDIFSKSEEGAGADDKNSSTSSSPNSNDDDDAPQSSKNVQRGKRGENFNNSKNSIRRDSNKKFLTPKINQEEPPTYQFSFKTATVDGLRIESVAKGVTYENGISIILAERATQVRLFGRDFTNNTIVRFVSELKARDEDCDDTPSTKTFPLTFISHNALSALVDLVFPTSNNGELFYLCLKENNIDMPWIHQGGDRWLIVKTYESFLPFWVQCVLISLLLLLSGLFAGLTLGLLALDRTDLRILANIGSEKERAYAKTILPLRTKGNYLLCSLVLGNVLVNSTLTILLDDLTSGIVAILFSTAGIVIIGEIIPQAFCSRHGLAVGAKTVWITKLIMLLTFPLSYTISVILDKILGEEIGIVYNREKLKELINVTNGQTDLETDEVNIISGALEMKKKTVEDIMTRLEDIFMLPIDGVLDFDSLSEIRKQGYSRIPIYDGKSTNIVSLLFTKDLVFVDSEDKIPLKTLAEFYKNPCFFVYASTTLDIVFKEFKECHHGHMAFVQKIHTGEHDPYYETIGLVTLEDVIEELIQSEIVDETDVWTDNRSKKRININQNKQDFSKFAELRNSQKQICISPQLALAAFQFLSTAIEPFKGNYISESVLLRLLRKNVIIKLRKPEDTTTHLFLYESGKPTEVFMLILEGRVEVVAGKENLIFDSGPFSYYGIPSLIPNTGDTLFVPDYTVRAVTDLIVLRIKRSLYFAAIQATILERAKSLSNPNDSNSVVDPMSIDEQIENVLRTVESETLIGQSNNGDSK